MTDYLEFDHFKTLPGLRHGVFTRQGGVSLPPWDQMNVGLACGDDPDHVRENRNRMLKALGLGRAVFLSQVHGDTVHVIRRSQVDKTQIWDVAQGQTPNPVTADAVITDAPDLGLVIQVADCQAVILYDPVSQVLANVHCGWRGSVGDILGKTVRRMVRDFGCRPEQIQAGISPSLGPCCAEFVNFQTELPKAFLAYQVRNSGPYFDFWQISRDQLLAQGLVQDRIGNLPYCTQCRTDLFFSYRREKHTGRFAAVAALISA